MKTRDIITLKHIGSGSFGEVSLVKVKGYSDQLVCKTMKYGKLSERKKQLIVSEVNLLRELSHPFIVKYCDRLIDKASEKLLLLMEHCEKGDLRTIIKSNLKHKIRFSETFIKKAFLQLCLAFEYCHSRPKPVLHRDVKPGNIFLDRHGNVKLGDFGLAKELVSQQHMATTVVGTPFYMPPEILYQGKYNEKCDIWSLGCVIFEMAALRPPFEGANMLTLSSRICSKRIGNIPARYSPRIHAIIHSLLVLDPEKRPSISDILRQKVLQHEISVARNEVLVLEKVSILDQKERDMIRREKLILQREVKVAEKEQKLRALFSCSAGTSVSIASFLDGTHKTEVFEK